MEEPSTIRSKPEALTVKRKIAKKAIPSQIRSPIIVYVKPPEVIKARPEQFMAVVQQLTGKDAVLPDFPASSGEADRSGRDEDEFRGGKGESSSSSFGGFGVGANSNWRDFGLTL